MSFRVGVSLATLPAALPVPQERDALTELLCVAQGGRRAAARLAYLGVDCPVWPTRLARRDSYSGVEFLAQLGQFVRRGGRLRGCARVNRRVTYRLAKHFGAFPCLAFLGPARLLFGVSGVQLVALPLG